MATYRTQYGKRHSCRCRTCEVVLSPFLGINEMDPPPSGWLPRLVASSVGLRYGIEKNGDGDFEVFLLLF
jgi:hypothetical protein